MLTHTHSYCVGPVHSPSTGQCLCSQHKHTAFPRSLAECNLRERAPLHSREDMSQAGMQPELRRATGPRRGSLGETRCFHGGVTDSRCPTPIEHQGTGFLKPELHNTCHEPSLADGPNSFSSDNLHKVHFFPLLVSPADGPPPQQQGFSVHPVKG